jgi:serine/threonine-protein kinase
VTTGCSSSGDAGPHDLGLLDGSGSRSDGNGLPDGSAPPDLSTGGADGATSQGPGGFPPNAPWYQDISAAGLASDSATIISNLQSVGWGTLKIDVSFYVNHADSSVARRSYTTNGAYYTPDCDLAPVPIPPGGAIENYPLNGYTCGGGDCHLLVYQGTRLYELSVASIAGGQYNGSPFTGGCLAIWDLTHDYWAAGATPYSRGEPCTSSDAAGFPIAPILLTAADLSESQIKHALRFTLPNSLIRDSVYVHPATHGTSSGGGGASGGANTMPYGSRLRLKAGSYPGIGAPGQIIVQALQTYGMFMSDGGNLYISGTSDLAGVVSNSVVSSLTPNDFEVVDSGPPILYNGNCARTPITN